MKWINELNTTSFRIIATVGLVYLTGLRYIASDIGKLEKWMPAWEWLVFLLAMAGVEGAVLIAKRLTDYEYKRIAAGAAQPTVNVGTANVQAAGDVKVETKPADDGAVG